MSMKNAPTSGTMRNATCEGPWRWVTAVMFAIAVGVAPRPKPMKPLTPLLRRSSVRALGSR